MSSTLKAQPSPAYVRDVIDALKRAYPTAECALTHENPFQLLIATILSAQCTDARVNMVTPALFARFPDAAAMSRASQEELEFIIRSTGFYRNKAKSIRGASTRIVEVFEGEVPRTMHELLSLPGVARKTANVVLGVGYGIADGVVVDTHVFRLARRLALSEARKPEMIESDLMSIVPREDWIALSHLLIFHGRQVCFARKPACPVCPIASLCPSAPYYLAGTEPPFLKAKVAGATKTTRTKAPRAAGKAAAKATPATKRAAPKRRAATTSEAAAAKRRAAPRPSAAKRRPLKATPKGKKK